MTSAKSSAPYLAFAVLFPPIALNSLVQLIRVAVGLHDDDRPASESLHPRCRSTSKRLQRLGRPGAEAVTVGLPLSEPGGTVLDMTKAVLRYEIRKLSLAERLELVEELWDSIAAECGHEPFPLTAGQRADLERRLAEADADPAGGAPWEEVLESIRQRPR